MKAEPTYQELKKELEELKKRDKSQVLLDYAGVMFIELDMKGNVTLANKKACEVFGYDEKEMLGKNWFENFLPEHIKKEVLPISEKLLSGEIETAEYYENPILTKTGEERLIQWHNAVIRDNSGKIIGHLSSGEDITERKKTEEALKRNHEKLNTVLNAFEDGVYMCSSNYEIQYLNPGMVDKIGRNAVGEKCHKAIYKLDKPCSWCYFNKLKKTKDSSSIEIERDNKNYIVTSVLLQDESKLSVYHDITKIKDAEKQLIIVNDKIVESESKYRKLSNLTFEGIVMHKAGIALDVNLSMSRMFGYTQEELIGKNIIKLLIPEKHHKAISDYVIEEYAIPYEVEGIKKDGSVFPIELEAKNITDENDNGFRVAAVRDITERKKIEDENKKLSTAVNQSVNIIVITDTSGNIEYTNPKFTELTGYSKEEVLGKKPYILKSGALSDEIYAELWNTISSGKEWKGEFHNKTKNGDFFWEAASISPIFNAQGEITNYLKIAEDITVRKQAEEALKKSEDKFKIIYDFAPDAIYLNDLKGNFIDGNKAAEKLLGYKKDELIGKSLLELNLLPTKELFKAAKSLAKNVLGKKTGPDEFLLSRKDGSEVLVEVSTFPVTIDGKKMVLGVAHNITQRKQAEKELRKNAASLKIITENAYDFIWTLDMHLNVTYASNSVQRLLGYTPEEIAKISASELYSPEQFKLIQSVFVEELAKGNPHKGIIFNVKHLRKNRTEFPVEVQATIIYDEKGEPVFIQGYTRDISSQLEAENKLKRSEERYRSLFDHSPDPIMVHDGKKILDVNPAILKAAGVENRSDLIGISPFAMTHPDDREKSEQRLKAMLKDSKPLEAEEFRFITKQNEIRTVLATPAPIVFDEKQAFMINYHDITERKNAQKALEQGEEKYRIMIETSNDLIWMLDTNGNITFFNKHVEEATGYLLKDLFGKSFVPLVVEDELPMLQEVMVKGMNGIPSSYEFRLKIADGSFLTLSVNTAPMLINGVVTGMFSFARDITQQKLDEQKIINALKKAEESELRFKALLDASLGGIAIHDKGVILNCNQGLSKLSGYSVDELIGMDGLLLIAKDSRDLVMKNILAEYEKPYEAFGVRKNGEKYPLRLEGRMIPYKGEKVRTVEFRDITEAKKAELEIINALDRAQESDRLKSAFLANMSHEIRTPMNGILGFSSLLKEPGLTGDKQQKYINIIEKSGNRMLNTINDIIDISRIESGQIDVTISEVNINEQIEYLNTFFKPEAEKKGLKLAFKRGLSTQESVIKTDREKFYSILTNLVKNAIKYSHKGSIEFGYNLKEENKIRELEFYVKDTGIGIPKDRQKAIFERFVQADIEDKDVYEGSGLGLAISSAYAEMISGTLWVESEVGVGSTFYFTIPYTTPQKEIVLRKEKSSADTEIQIKKLKILIADDEETAELYMTIVLTKYNKELLIANTGRKAVEFCRNNPDIDLVLMDIRMPGMNGYEATRQIRKFNKDVVIIAQTAFGLGGDREKAIEAGCNDYISKPIKKEELLEKIKTLFGAG